MNLRTLEKRISDQCRNPNPLCGTTASCVYGSIFSATSMPISLAQVVNLPATSLGTDHGSLTDCANVKLWTHRAYVRTNANLSHPPPAHFGQNLRRDAPRVQSQSHSLYQFELSLYLGCGVIRACCKENYGFNPNRQDFCRFLQAEGEVGRESGPTHHFLYRWCVGFL